MKKLTSILLVLALIFSFGLTASAAPVTTGTITITTNATVDTLEGRTFEAYQLFTATTTYEVAGVTYYNYVPTPLLKAVVADMTDTTGWTDVQYVNYVNDTILANETSAEFKAFSEALDSVIDAAGSTYTPDKTATGAAGATSVTLTDMPFGYYYIRENSANLGLGVEAMLFAFQTSNVTIQIKANTIEFEKTVVDPNGAEINVDGRNYSIGDTVNYQLTAVVPSIPQNSTASTYTFTDTMGAGLAYKGDAVAKYFNGTDYIAIPTSYVTNNTTTTADFSLTIDFLAWYNSFSDKDDYPAGADIVVGYSAVITTDAIDLTGLDNKATLTHDPDKEPYEKNVEVFSYGFKFLKTNGTDKLAGAEFKLYDTAPQIVDGEYVYGTPLTFIKDTTGAYVLSSGGNETLISDNGEFIIFGLKAGTYWLEETASPDGYNLLTAPVAITITAGGASWTVSVAGETGSYTYADKAAFLSSEASIGFNVLNSSSVELPGTGGIGTILFTIFGCGIILGGCVLLIVNRKRVFGK